MLIEEDCILGDLPIETYHQQICAGPSVSSSNLRDVELKSPAHMYAGWSGNPNAEPADSSALAFGSAAHALILGDEVFSDRHVISPFQNFSATETIDEIEWRPRRLAKPNENSPAATKRAYEKVMAKYHAGELRFKSDWKLAMEQQGRRIITDDDYQHIEGMAESLSRHPLAKDGVLQGEVEQSVFWKDEATGLWCKSRMDARPIGDTLTDLKTTTDAAPFKCRQTVQSYAYDMQFALGAEGLWRVAGQKILAHLIVFIEKTPPYAVTPVEISAQAIWRAAQRNERARAVIADCLKRGEWPAYAMPEPYYPPEWLETQLQRDEDSKLLPPPPAWLEELKEAV